MLLFFMAKHEIKSHVGAKGKTFCVMHAIQLGGCIYANVARYNIILNKAKNVGFMASWSSHPV